MKTILSDPASEHDPIEEGYKTLDAPLPIEDVDEDCKY